MYLLATTRVSHLELYHCNVRELFLKDIEILFCPIYKAQICGEKVK